MDQRSTWLMTDLLMVHGSLLYQPSQYLTFIWHPSFIPSILPSNPHCPNCYSLKLPQLPIALADKSLGWGCCDMGLSWLYGTNFDHRSTRFDDKVVRILPKSMFRMMLLVTALIFWWLANILKSTLIVGGICPGVEFSASSLHHVGIADLFPDICFLCGLMAYTQTLSSVRPSRWENKTLEIHGLFSGQLQLSFIDKHQHNAFVRL